MLVNLVRVGARIAKAQIREEPQLARVGLTTISDPWDPYDAQSWASAFGFVATPLFGSGGAASGDYTVLLDGAKSSMSFATGVDPLAAGLTELSYSWSANLLHLVVPDNKSERIYVRRWDDRTVVRQFSAPDSHATAAHLLDKVAHLPKPGAPGVVEHVMQVFRFLRGQAQDAEAAVRLLDCVLLAARQVNLGHTTESDVRDATTVSDILEHVPESLRATIGLDDLKALPATADVSEAVRFLLDRAPQTGCELRADILFRHAASQLFQEAHFDIERQLHFLGAAPIPRGHGGPSEIRYTPPHLARSLAEQALKHIDAPNHELIVLDPACGSGVFLVEMARAAESHGGMPTVRLTGYDQSPAAVTIARSCLALADVEQPGLETTIEVSVRDALEGTWCSPHVILMNPPFRSWADMSAEERGPVEAELEGVGKGRKDKAMAFLWKAWKCLRPGGVLAAVLPAPLLDNKSAEGLRAAISEQASIKLIGRFEGFTYFERSLVETAFVILKKNGAAPAALTDVLLAGKGYEDTALRLLRSRNSLATVRPERVELFDTPVSVLANSSWYPRGKSDMQLLEILRSSHHPPVKSRFNIRQGVRTGDKRVFLLSIDEYEALPKRERKYFRPAAGQGSIESGVLTETQFVFYPYDASGLLLASLDAVMKAVPRYHERWLEPNRQTLKHRKGISEWWLPTWPRPWQYEAKAKLVSAYFGDSGSFAYDVVGTYVVVNGFAWIGKIGDDVENADENAGMEEDINWAYLALLNSRVFERVLHCYSWRVQGGQLRLEGRFLKDVPLPDIDADTNSNLHWQRLHDYGRDIHRGRLESIVERMDDTVAALYGIPMDLLQP